MEFSELTNKELKGILRENQVKNYSKLNKKELVKKVNQLTRKQNGGKKYTLKELIGGAPDELKQPILSNNNRKQKNGPPTIYTREPMGYQPPSPANIPITQNEKNRATLQQQQQPSAPALSQNEIKKLENNEEARQIKEATRLSLENQVNNNKGKNECGACSIQ